ncbi:protein unc-79 homolog isoform X2 [Ischnura elegans]|uniref:protein unc-79 homolog isoform X2 n=1 Tax=Ischnura elegans TaxID=197161 RepID=UPI001ED86705|nr:protein unc-79 homolog isoform X2 [Ischnura elegans]
MGTRAAAFTAKIQSLHDYQLRLLHGIVPFPSGIDIANTLKHFSQTLLTVLKDVPSSPLEMLKFPEKDAIRMGLYPNLDYKGLYHAIVQLMDVAPLIQYGLQAFGQCVLQCLGCLLPFLGHDLIDSLPCLVASSMAVLPVTLHQTIVNTLCFYVLPFTIARADEQSLQQQHMSSYAGHSVSSIIMLIFQYSTSPSQHCQLLECLMSMRANIAQDLLCVIAHGTTPARAAAAKLLFHYWPPFCSALVPLELQRRQGGGTPATSIKFTSEWTPFVCQRDACPSAGTAEAVKVCFDHGIAIAFSAESGSPPPLYLCIECANEIHRAHPDRAFHDLLHPVQSQVSLSCENKSCRSTQKLVVAVCFSMDCASYNGNRPIRYCRQCHAMRHSRRRGGEVHMVHTALLPAHHMDPQTQTYLVEAIVSLLKESKSPDAVGSDSTEMQLLSSGTLLSSVGGVGIGGAVGGGGAATCGVSTAGGVTSGSGSVGGVGGSSATCGSDTGTSGGPVVTGVVVGGTGVTSSVGGGGAGLGVTTVSGGLGEGSGSAGSSGSQIDPGGRLTIEDRQLLGRYGVWLLVELCEAVKKPGEESEEAKKKESLGETLDVPMMVKTGKGLPLPPRTLGRLLSMLFHWFDATAYSFDDQLESVPERLKAEHVCGWLSCICHSHLDLFVSCLLPHPPDFARVGGHWETLSSKTWHLREGLNRLLCLVPYEVVLPEIWDHAMPHWMEAIASDVPQRELPHLRTLLSKILDPDMSPLGFDAKKMYHFISIRFKKTAAKVQEQALNWLQILTTLEIVIPLHLLFSMFGNGVKGMRGGRLEKCSETLPHESIPVPLAPSSSSSSHGAENGKSHNSSISPVVEDSGGQASPLSEDEEGGGSPPGAQGHHRSPPQVETDAELNLPCCIFMLDILLRQMELQEIECHSGTETPLAEDSWRLLRSMLAVSWIGTHTCGRACRSYPATLAEDGSAQATQDQMPQAPPSRSPGVKLQVAVGIEDEANTDCVLCESIVVWHQLALRLVRFLTPEFPAHAPDSEVEEGSSGTGEDGAGGGSGSGTTGQACSHGIGSSEKQGRGSGPSQSDNKTSEVAICMPLPEILSVGGVLVNMPQAMPFQNSTIMKIMTATVETVSEQLDLAPIIPTERVLPAVARAITLTDTDVATATVQVAKATLVGEDEEVGDGCWKDDDGTGIGEGSGADGAGGEGDQFWHTSVGKFRFALEDLPQTLQLIHCLLKEVEAAEQEEIEKEVVYHLLRCLHALCLHGDAFTAAARDHRGFLIWCQENLLIRNFWELLNAEHSHICEVAVPLLLHCVTLPAGSDVFWTLMQEQFHSTDWRVRFSAVERVTVIARFMDASPLRGVVPLQLALANAFCHLVSSMDDLNVQVAQRATLYLGTIHDRAIRSLIMCLETQFDLVIVDRPMVLQTLYQLHNSLSDRRGILTWEFFLNRFDTLFLEAQINLKKSGGDEISYLRDLRNTDLKSETFIRKLNRAQEALSQPPVKTLSASFGTKWPYKRTMSAPASMVPRTDKQEKVYSRQYSAPILKRKSSRFGLDGHIQSITSIEDSQIIGYLQRVIEFEEADHETMHLLVFLLMQFLSRSDQAFPTGEKSVAKTQGIVLRHLYLLLGYSQTDRGFHVPPQKLRTSSVFNVFLSNLPQLLDHNHLLGWLLVPTTLMLLQYCPCPPPQPTSSTFSASATPGAQTHHHAQFTHPLIPTGAASVPFAALVSPAAPAGPSTFSISAAPISMTPPQMPAMGPGASLGGGGSLSSGATSTLPSSGSAPPSSSALPEYHHQQQPTYSLWCLEPHSRRCWLMSLLVLLYKYQYGQQPFSANVQSLVKIVLNTLDAQRHQCKRVPTNLVIGSQNSRSRDVSQPSLGGELEPSGDTPPPSPHYPDASSGTEALISRSASLTSGGMDPKMAVAGVVVGAMGVAVHRKPLVTSAAAAVATAVAGGRMAGNMETHWEAEEEEERKRREVTATREAPKEVATTVDEGRRRRMLRRGLSGERWAGSSLEEEEEPEEERRRGRRQRRRVVDTQTGHRSVLPVLSGPESSLSMEEEEDVLESELAGIGPNSSTKSSDSTLHGGGVGGCGDIVCGGHSSSSSSFIAEEAAPLMATHIVGEVAHAPMNLEEAKATAVIVSEEGSLGAVSQFGVQLTPGVALAEARRVTVGPPAVVVASSMTTAVHHGAIPSSVLSEGASLGKQMKPHLSTSSTSPSSPSSSPTPSGTSALGQQRAAAFQQSRTLPASGSATSGELEGVWCATELVPIRRKLSDSASLGTSPVSTGPATGSEGTWHDNYSKQLSYPVVERLLPIGTSRLASFLEADSSENYGSSSDLTSPPPLGHPTATSMLPDVLACTPMLSIPTPERLLPIGGSQHPESISALVDKVCNALGVGGMPHSPSGSHHGVDFMDSDSASHPNPSRQCGSEKSDHLNSDHCGTAVALKPFKTEDSSVPGHLSIHQTASDGMSSRAAVGCSETSSPRKLKKQVALESPPLQSSGPFTRSVIHGAGEGAEDGTSHSQFYRTVHYDRKPAARHDEFGRPHLRQGQKTTASSNQQLSHQQQQAQRGRKVGVFTMGPHSVADMPSRPGFWSGPGNVQPEAEQAQSASQGSCHSAPSDFKQSALRFGEESVYERCCECGSVREEYSDEELGLCIIVLGTFVHREPALAAPLLPEVLRIVAKVALNATYPWQSETNIYLPGGAISVAHQFLRCVLHQLAPNGVFVQMFQTQVDDTTRMRFFRSVAQALLDFNELNPIAPLQLLLENLNSRKSLPLDTLPCILHNVACYLDCLPLLEVGGGSGGGGGWGGMGGMGTTSMGLTLGGGMGIGGGLPMGGSGNPGVCSTSAVGPSAGALSSMPGSSSCGAGPSPSVGPGGVLGSGVGVTGGGGVGPGGVGGGVAMGAGAVGPGGCPSSAGGQPPGGGPPSGWTALISQMELLFRRLVLSLGSLGGGHIAIRALLRIMAAILKVPGVASFKGILDPFSKVLSCAIQNHVMKYQSLVDLCYLCNRAFSKERDKLLLTRMVIFELVQALKFKTSIPDTNFLMLINFVLQDAGGCLPLRVLLEEELPPAPGPEFGAPSSSASPPALYSTSASEIMRHHLSDCLDFLSDFHTLSKIKSYCKGVSVGLNEDTLGGTIKSGVAQFVALELTRGNSRDNRAIGRHLPWLYNAPSSLQQGPREFIDCVAHIRLLSWLLLGSLMHTALLGGSGGGGGPGGSTKPSVGAPGGCILIGGGLVAAPTNSASSASSTSAAGPAISHASPGSLLCQPIPQEASCHVADHVQVILAGFAEQSKASVLHMSSLFHAFILCQLWTVYLEQMAWGWAPSSEAHAITMGIVFDFWGKVTPCILQLVSHCKVLAEMVNLHFLSLMEALLECNSTILSKLLPLWSPVLFAYHTQLPGHLQVRLQGCRNFPPSGSPTPGCPPSSPTSSQSQQVSRGSKLHSLTSQSRSPSQNCGNTRPACRGALLRWLQRLQFKMGQIELQSSAATQFYSV